MTIDAAGTLPEPAPVPPPGYLDAVGGQPLLPVARRAWDAAAEQAWSDPARRHHEGRRAGLVLDAASAAAGDPATSRAGNLDGAEFRAPPRPRPLPPCITAAEQAAHENFIAELGDKTMLATVTLATDNGLLGTWIGSTLGMVAADALAILVGRQLGARLPERVVKIGAAITFVVFGVWLIADGLR